MVICSLVVSVISVISVIERDLTVFDVLPILDPWDLYTYVLLAAAHFRDLDLNGGRVRSGYKNARCDECGNYDTYLHANEWPTVEINGSETHSQFMTKGIL